jgi:hypothetical protein
MVKEIYQAVDRAEARAKLKKTVEAYKEKTGKFCDWLE